MTQTKSQNNKDRKIYMFYAPSTTLIIHCTMECTLHARTVNPPGKVEFQGKCLQNVVIDIDTKIGGWNN